MIHGKNKNIKWAYVAIPRTSSNSMVHWLRRNYGGQQYGHHHSWRSPHEAFFDQVFTILRHPYFRACSIVRNIIRTGAPPNRIPWGKARTPTEILKRINELSRNIEPNAYTVPEWMVNQARYCELAQVDTILYLDYIRGMTEEQLTKLKFIDRRKKIPPYPRMNVTPLEFERYDYRDITEEDEALIFQWAKEDFERFEFVRFLGREIT